MKGEKRMIAFVCAACGGTFYHDIAYVRDRVKRLKPVKYCGRACSYVGSSTRMKGVPR